ncbi:UNVERIFIED_CONTAM: hypothetical protein HDU68_009146 [Siphonaria sp. JEL0065]|nr:hypothetical protein HDU68_009146 [Siphonaria sp. JEL0065]
MALPSSSSVDKINQLNFSMGTVSFATVVFMLHSNSYTISLHPRTWVRSMIYLDSLGFFIYYLAEFIQDSASCKQYTLMQMMADVVWSFKDAFKFGYIVYRGLAISGSKRNWPYIYTALISLILYWYFIYLTYIPMLQSPNCQATAATNPKIILYSYWSLIEIGISLVIVIKMSIAQQRVRAANFAVETYSRYKQKEEMRLLIACVGMGTVTMLEVVDHFRGSNVWQKEVYITRIVFVYLQLMLLLGSTTGDFRNDLAEEDEDEELDDDPRQVAALVAGPATQRGTNKPAFQRMSYISSK